MNLPLHPRRSAVRLAMLAIAMLAVGLSAPVNSIASAAGTRAEQRAAIAEERAAARAQERAQRLQEREARRLARREERAARRAADGASGRGNGVTKDEGSAGSAPPAAPPAGEPGSSKRGRCRLTIAASSNRITVGETVELTGKLQCPSGTSVESVPITVSVHHRLAGLSAVATATTASDGSFQLTSPALTTNSIFYVRASIARGSRTAVTVAPVVTLAAPGASAQSAAAGVRPGIGTPNRATFTGTVSPADPGALVVLQVSRGAAARWQSVAFGHVAADGSYSVTHSFRIPGQASVRTIVHAGTENVAAVSEALPYEVAQRQNPQLTIDASADPIAYGQSVTISGIAAGMTSQPVTLLARTRGGGFAVVATATTDATGHYTFSAEPLASTYYRVTDATTRSSALFEGVGFAVTADPIGGLAAGTEPAPDAVAAGGQLTFSGTLNPARVGQPVYLERGYASGTGFRVVGEGTVDGSSTYTISHAFQAPGSELLRIRVPSDGERLASTSAPFTITVAP